MRAGVEVGGTFTDLVAVDGDTVVLTKVPSTPSAPDRGVLTALEKAALDLSRIEDLVHGSTVATNALLERKGAKVAFVTTEGFRDILFLQRHDRRNIYDLRYAKPKPVVDRRDCFEVAERIDASGAVIEPLEVEAAAEALTPSIRDGGYQAVAICLLSAYANPEHEQALQTALSKRLPGLFITCSFDVSREFREYERASTTTLAAYVQPVIDAYLGRLTGALAERGFDNRFSVMQSNGGRLPVEGMQRNAIAALFSGPAAGVVGAIRQAGRSNVTNLITFDMGGTSTDVCLVTDGMPGISPETELDGLPIRTPVLDIATVGAGGGSLIWIDDGGMLRVGPRSAGAEPGPACYGKGGAQPTITDAHVLRGTIRPEAFLGGSMEIYPEKAREAFQPIADSLGMTVEQAAASALRLGVANIVRTIQHISTEKGRDPRDYALVPFGGAGPLVAAEIAAELGVASVLVPPNPGVLSAFGLFASDFQKIYAATRRFVVEEDAGDHLREAFATMQAEAQADFAGFGLEGDLAYVFTADMRFVGQAFEIPVTVPLEQVATIGKQALIDAFIEAHTQVYMHSASPSMKIEVVAFRLSASRPLDELPAFRERPIDPPARSSAPIIGADGPAEARILRCIDLEVGAPLAGPAMIEGYSSSTYVPDGWTVSRDEHDNLTLTRR